MILMDKTVDELRVKVYSDRAEMGREAAKETAEIIRKLLSAKDKISMIFAAAPSQNEFLAALCEEKNIEWSRIDAYHMDEYVGLAPDASQGFGNFQTSSLWRGALSNGSGRSGKILSGL